MATSRVEIAQYWAKEVFRCYHFNFHDWLEQQRTTLANTIFQCHRGRNFEGHFRRVNLVERTIVQDCLDINHRVASYNTCFQGLLDTGFNWSDILPRNSTANNLVDELKAFAAFLWLKPH